MTTLPTVDFRSAAFRADPYPILAELRSLDPVHRHPSGIWLLTRHADVVAVNRDPRFGRDPRRRSGYAVARPFGAGSALEETVERWMLMLDPPEHGRIRQLVSRAFTPNAVDGMAGLVGRVAMDLLDRIDVGEVDLMERFARPFPVAVITAVLGLDPTRSEVVHRHTAELASVVEPAATPAMQRRAIAAVHVLRREFAAAVNGPGFPGSVLATLRGSEESGRIDDAELIANLMLLFVAGHETTTNLLGNGLHALVRHPEQLERLRRDPGLIPGAVDELLRYDSPVTVNSRVAHELVEIGERLVEPGELVYAMLGAANRDPQVFDRPDALDVMRPNPAHTSFGGGVHFCLGAALARLEAAVALRLVLERWSVIELAPGHRPTYRDLVNLRGLEQLVLRLGR